ncbi:hypothetical protein ZIOFF_066044 [Zingiber officinale]|uniref:Transcription factor TFIIB cyclin-like domain-containing protein n=1 Tax=Zingiber officinale TaxID=94328 RepID=A0A8J5F2B4_ZINOF|nr:hypothetical protein ZIOFF_066044 [Zingiber officinale]
MGWCSNCEECPIYRDPENGYVLYLMWKDSRSRDLLQSSHFCKGYWWPGRDEISYIVNVLNISGGDSIINNACAFYEMVVDTNFTKGCKISHVAATCLYLACRQSKKDYLLIDFSDYLKINVVLDSYDCSDCKKNDAVSELALRLVASMKRDWMQTGKKPNGLCGATLYISVHSHGLNYSKSDISLESPLNLQNQLSSYIDIGRGWVPRCVRSQLLQNEGSCDGNMTPYVGHVEGKASKESKEPCSAGHELIDPSTFSEQHGFADSEDDGSDYLSFSDIDDAGLINSNEKEEPESSEVDLPDPSSDDEETLDIHKRPLGL